MTFWLPNAGANLAEVATSLAATRDC
jgi:hypothetical protein